ncbi:tyrosine-type recombinase/integrase [Oceanobacillus sp. 143]|uniref:Tyr recombinase domain-containing protein n=1 Tax=Oceanobacillus zhaokaii TaxID=2052660 RepID=A0A345PM98_9BACI|nr:hypothetical protein CUC15_07825 [Oceanobacillus zhaokaii]QGS68520.1 tyrosine-type recombinase/integrase [Oceanobacillus sp. 143]
MRTPIIKFQYLQRPQQEVSELPLCLSNTIQDEAANVPYISFHNLRHNHATILMRMGENLKVISERLGHARVGITLDIY